jgi:Zn-dependent protease
MVKLRKFLCACFGQVALLFLVVSITCAPRIFTFDAGYEPDQISREVWRQIAVAVLLLLARLIFAIPLVLTVLYGMAWWTVRKGKASGRRWAIAASIVMIAQGIPVIALTAYTGREDHGLAFEGGIVLGLITLGIGVPGLLAFWTRNSVLNVGSHAIHGPRTAGDGTSRILDSLAWLVQIAGCFYGMSLWDRWGRSLKLSLPPEIRFWLEIVLAILFTIVVHELGHAGVGKALGMRLCSFIVGPFQFFKRDGRWKFKFEFAHILSARGGAGVVPSDVNQKVWDEVCMIAAGPMVNLFTGVLAMCAAIAAPGARWEPYWYFFALLATLSFTAFAGNLIPFRPEGSYSDGARIYQLLRGGPMADLHRAFNLASATQVTALRPRDYDINAIHRAAAVFTQGQRALLLRLIGAEHFLDHGAIPEFCAELSQAEAICAESVPDPPADWLTIFVFGNALLKRDAVQARQWWNPVEAAKNVQRGVNYWLALGALQWAEGDREAAAHQCMQGDAAAKNPALCGSDEFDLYRLNLLRRTIAQPAFAVEAASLEIRPVRLSQAAESLHRSGGLSRSGQEVVSAV